MRAAKKIRSQDGASITFALLLFLVCAVVSSVLIAAGSAAAGRASRAAEMDQRYYSVTSAADLLRSTLDGQSVEVQTGTVVTETRYSNGAAVTTEEEQLPTTIDGVSDDGTSFPAASGASSTFQLFDSRSAWYVQSQPYSLKSAMQSAR